MRPEQPVTGATEIHGQTEARRATNRPVRRRVLFMDHTATLGGGELALLALVTRLDRQRYDPTVLLFGDGPLRRDLEAAGVNVQLLELPDQIAGAQKDGLGLCTLLRVRDVVGAVRYVFRLRRFVRGGKYDLVHTNSLKSDLLGGAAARLAAKPLVWHVRDRIAKDYLPPAVVVAFRALSGWVPTFIIANSNSTLLTLPPSARRRAVAVPSGIDLAAAAEGAGAAPHSCGDAPSGHCPVLGLVGRLARWKGQHVFLRAAALVRERFPNAKFQIIGSALFEEHAYEAELKELVRTLGLQEHVEFLGFRRDVQKLISAMDVLVHASLTGEPFGQVIVQGMAAGKPVVATDGGGVPEIVVDGVTGLLVPMGSAEAMAEAINRLLSDPSSAAAMGRAGYERVRSHFTIERTVRDVERVYDQLLGEAMPSPAGQDEGP